MNNWLKYLREFFKELFRNELTSDLPPQDTEEQDSASSISRIGQHEDNRDVSTRLMSPQAKDFLLALVSEKPAANLQEFSLYDRAFISTLLKKLRTNTFEIPLLPEAALHIQKLLSTPRVNASEFVDIFKNDPALSAELIRLANSVYYGATIPVHDLQLAVTRVGLNQIQGLVIMMSLRTRILRGKGLHREVEWITELSLMMAIACQQLASELAMSPGEAFTLGLLHHVEYFAVLGVSAEYISSHHGDAISAEALMEAMHRLGPPVHELIVRNWGLEILELPELVPLDEDEEPSQGDISVGLRAKLDFLQRILIEKWSGANPEPVVAGFTTEAVCRAVAAIFPTDADISTSKRNSDQQ
ncbi:MAG: HDOD domain-containing protein [Geobacter sp.]|nr:HDOD domain-containing protein [Geobacter sp.]